MESLRAVAKAVSVRTYRDRQTLCVEGHDAERVFFIRAGAVRLTRVEPDGSEILLGFVGPGGALGIEALFSNETSTTATACGVVDCCTASVADLRSLLPANPGLLLALLRMVHEDLVGLRARVAELSSWNAEQRVARFLVETLPIWQSMVPAFTQADVARSLALTPETLCRVLGEFRQLNWVRGQGRSLAVLEREELEQISVGRS